MIVPDPSRMYSGSGAIESKSVGTVSPLQKQDSHRGLLVDRGVGSPRLVKSASSSSFAFDQKFPAKPKVSVISSFTSAVLILAFVSQFSDVCLFVQNSMPAAAGAVAAAAIADQMLGPKEDAHLAIVLVLSFLFYLWRSNTLCM